ncbi:YkvA family protein [Prosthecomicrobium sp. N25]|uniref:YkvA family protein n=1 Tax=Prosthecomicrobium sp. N25 TaxID=3129254 RepID=UPI0030772AB6
MTFDQRVFLDPEIVGPEEEREAKVRAGLWSTLKRAARAVPFAEDVVAAYYCALDPATPRRVRLIILGALAYFVVPTDVLPDFLPFLGFTDDVTVLMTAFGTVTGHIEERHRAAARQALSENA